MDPKALAPHGEALLAFFTGNTSAELTIRRDDGIVHSLPVSHFFRTPDEFLPLEITAIGHCRGHVLDIGAGTGLHSLALQSRGLKVTAIDIVHQAVEIMTQRGVRDVHCDDVFQFQGGPFDTLLMLGHGIGMVEDLPGLQRFLSRAHKLTATNGQLLIHTLDARKTDDPDNLAYHEANRRAGRYIGATRLQFEYAGERGPYSGWLHVDPETLSERARQAEWACDIIRVESSGDYLARLTSL
jgi:SAM-dependent methyltransferase